ncbi:HD domain-containing phosphohydrolase [Thermotoga sp. KOL6]|uniref:HD domain-containing phosphohydrolase n=1 Tax=Thermotoga sp. KOL6 TaxID=126741 RepID=UPI000C779A73|nr:HD domain-containing phosphohydrolase [Thermotoga sp. KOL6]PLV60326.1 metal-dependent phosphohydrolase [Thermotoga sp. KOL6]
MNVRTLQETIKDVIYRRNLLFVLIISIAVSIVVTLITYHIEKRTVLEKLNFIEKEWSKTIDNYKDILNFLANNPSNFRNPGDILKALKLIREYFSDYTAYPIFATPDGNYYIYPSATLPPGYDPRERPWYKSAVENPNVAVISPPLVHKILNVVTIGISRAVFDENGKFLGVLAVDIVPEKIMKDVLPIGVYVMNKGGKVLLQNGKIFVHVSPENEDTGVKFQASYIAFFKRSIDDTVFVMQLPFFKILRNSLLHIGYIFGLSYLLGMIILTKIKRVLIKELNEPLKKFSRSAEEYLRSRVFDVSGISSNILEINQLIDDVADMITIIESQREELEASYEELEASYSELQKMAQEIEEKGRALAEAYEFFAYKMADIVEGFDEPTGAHVRRVQELSRFFAEKLELPEDLVRQIYLYSPLHDIGKIRVPKEILNKKGRLTPEEWEIMKKHTVWGGELLSGRKELTVAKNIALYHHENYDGTGYPFGLKNGEIPIEAQIVKLADVYDALRSKRPYKPALDHETAVRIILEGDGKTLPSHFNPELLKILKKYSEEIKKIWESAQ